MRAIAFLLISALIVSGASAQLANANSSTPVTLYFHLDGFQDFPVNTQPPMDFASDSTGSGTTGMTSTCLPDGAPNQIKGDFHTYYGYSTPGYVEYDELDKNGTIRVHEERGLASDVMLDQPAGATLYWYLVADFGNRGVEAGEVPVVVPQVKVAATIRTGDAVGLGPGPYNDGQMIGSGISAPQDIAPSPANEGPVIYEFQVPVTFDVDKISKTEAFNIRVDVMMDVPSCNEVGSAFMLGLVDTYTAKDFRPRMDLSIMNPVFVEYVHPQISGDRLIIHTGLGSPWGNYDVDETPGGIEITISGPSEAKSIQRAAVVQRTHEHNHHFEPVDVTYVWPYVSEGATIAEYDIDVKVWNDQRTGFSTGGASIDLQTRTGYDAEGNEVGEEKLDEAEESPVGIILPMLGLLGFALLRRK
jgi:hypothetical protein